MAAPPSITLTSLTGNYTLNKSLSDSADKLLTLQGFPWLTRKALNLATITLHISQFTDSSSPRMQIHIWQTAAGGIKSGPERRIFNSQSVSYDLPPMGKITGHSEILSLESIEDEFLRSGWEDEGNGVGQEGKGGEMEMLKSFIKNEEKGWSCDQVWGFKILGKEEGKRYYCRNVLLVEKGGKRTELEFVYDYLGEYTEVK